MIQLFTFAIYSTEKSFSDCFSAASYIQGNIIDHTLTLHLIPFENIDQITKDNICKQYLPGKSAKISIIFEGGTSGSRTFTDGRDEDGNAVPVQFLYEYNTLMNATFYLTSAQYNDIIDVQNAMYIVTYDYSLLNVKSSISHISHYQKNDARCFKRLEFQYIPYQHIKIIVEPIGCNVPMGSAKVSLQYHMQNSDVLQLQIPQCLGGCDANEYDGVNVFQDITIYQMKEDNLPLVLTQEFENFFDYFLKHRMINVYLDIEYTVGTMISKVHQQIFNITGLDPDSYIQKGQVEIFLVTNQENVFLQYKFLSFGTNSLDNKPTPATKIHIQIYLISDDRKDVFYIEDTTSIVDFNSNHGHIIKQNESYQDFANRLYNKDENFNYQMFMEYMDDNNNIYYELAIYDIVYFGCYTDASMIVYDDKICVRIHNVLYLDYCKNNHLIMDQPNLVGFKYKTKDGYRDLGYFDLLNFDYNYSVFWEMKCFQCDKYNVSQTSVIDRCEDIFSTLKEMNKNKSVVTTLQNFNEFLATSNVVVQASASIFIPAIGAFICVLIIVVVVSGVYISKFFQTSEIM